jgi:hypothetical protein
MSAKSRVLTIALVVLVVIVILFEAYGNALFAGG